MQLTNAASKIYYLELKLNILRLTKICLYFYVIFYFF